MKHVSYLATAFSIASFPGFADTINVGSVQVYNVSSYTIDPAALQGFEKALGDELCKRAGFSCDWKVLPPEQLWSALQAGEVDAIVAGVSMGDEAIDGVDRTMPYLMLDPFLHIGLPGTQWTIEGAIISHLPDPAVTAYAQTTGASFNEYETLEAALAAVRDRQVMSLFGEREALVPVAEASGGEFVIIGNRDEIKIKPGIAMAVRSDDMDLRFAFEDQIFDMSQDGSLNTLTETWFGVDAARW
ncbi:transporter substrate-binding domain-containing protein [Actibacterium pelagium]|uniref:Amino acid ABC transporter n=1 Tax=Actibacterium pelagium TaxID=2029103 RepID=A0A917EKQ9_9RHOB|nr:transporter substrate-binding domain-containing protein [Actibacterium pelagium]GGE57884.1 amino acid ABC transporter [Actibacterium pelagium]